MKLRLIGILVGLGALVASFEACNIEQPKPTCPVAHGTFAAKYTLKSGAGPCAELPGELVGLEKYNVPGTTENSIAVRPEGVGNLRDEGRVDPADPEGKKANALAKLAYVSDADNMCPATDFTKIEQRFEAVLEPDGGVESPEQFVAYEWSDMKIVSLPRVPGTQFSATVKVTQDTCQATYDVVGVWPAVSCAKEVENPDGGDPLSEPDESLCHPDVDAGVPAACEDGLCLNTEFAVTCEPTMMKCVLAKAPPALLP